MNYEIAANILAEIKPARRKRERYRQRDEMQHRVIPLLPADDRDRFEREKMCIRDRVKRHHGSRKRNRARRRG